jgi:uncharacterized membrane protein YqjE
MIVSALFFFFLGLVISSLFIVIYYWESDRMLALGLLTASSLFIGLILAFMIMHSLRAMPKLFEASIAEFASDREALAK